MRALVLTLALITTAQAQWQLQTSNTTADLRGIHSLGNGVAWASGTNGTVLHTTDNGLHWQLCSTPPDAAHLDFRGIQAFDADTAIVMSSGKGDLSRLYKTTNGCQTWKLIFTNPDKDGFWDAITGTKEKTLYLLGDPVDGKFAMYFTEDNGETWFTAGEPGRDSPAGSGVFAASNSSLLFADPFMLYGTGAGTNSLPRVFRTQAKCIPPPNNPKGFPNHCTLEWVSSTVPLNGSSAASGVFSIAARTINKTGNGQLIVLAVGGKYDKPNDTVGTSAISNNGGQTWTAATTPPHGYRSAVAYSPAIKSWITVGPNGTDISTDDGRNWHPLTPASSNAQPDEDRNWNALSLPFVVGPQGRIGLLRLTALEQTSKH